MEKINGKYICWRSFHSLKITPSNVGFKVLTAANMAVCWMLSRKVWQKLKDDSVSTASIIRTRRSHFGTSNDRIFHHKLASASKTLFTSL